ncbi:hypothetical protein WN48_05073 [Eufriesea mexicana]|nr:hypothetical protein WN48_05073 [Eufriesea mexicana]
MVSEDADEKFLRILRVEVSRDEDREFCSQGDVVLGGVQSTDKAAEESAARFECYFNDLSREDSTTAAHRSTTAYSRTDEPTTDRGEKVNENYTEPRGVPLLAHTPEIAHCVKRGYDGRRTGVEIVVTTTGKRTSADGLENIPEGTRLCGLNAEDQAIHLGGRSHS